jgi:hypothetical protein
MKWADWGQPRRSLLILSEADKDPKVTLFLLEYWKQNIADQKTQERVQETLQYVLHQASGA